MRKPRWFRSKKLPDMPIEFTTHMARYELTHHEDGHKVVLTVHLPSRRVSERHYNNMGVLKKYISASPMSDQHIEYLCANAPELQNTIHIAESIQETNNTIRQSNVRFRRMRRIKVLLISIAIWLAVWGTLTSLQNY